VLPAVGPAQVLPEGAGGEALQALALIARVHHERRPERRLELHRSWIGDFGVRGAVRCKRFSAMMPSSATRFARFWRPFV